MKVLKFVFKSDGESWEVCLKKLTLDFKLAYNYQCFPPGICSLYLCV